MPQPIHVSFIHGLANKPAPEQLHRIWLEALAKPTQHDAGFDLGAVGVTTSSIYWADLFYDEPLAATDYESSADRNALLTESTSEELELKGNEAWLESMMQRYPEEFEDAPELDEASMEVPEAEAGYERIPLPWFLKKRIMRHFLREAHDYLFNVNGTRDTIRERFMADAQKIPAESQHVIVGHSQGSIIAYDALTAIPECKPVHALLTLGSPLGLDEVQDHLVWTRDNGYPQNIECDWVNVYDKFDVVSRPDPCLANDFRRDGREILVDVKEQNWGRWRHSATKYFQGPKLRGHLRRLCGRE